MRLDSEEKFLACIDRHFPRRHPHLVLGRGDDCGVLPASTELCVSSDLFLEDQHFRTRYFSPEDIGYKALAVSISDIAAMGAKPLAFGMDLMIPADVPGEFWEKFFSGMSQIARQNDLALVGGDLSRAEKIGVSITIYGQPGSGGRFVQRENCKPGDILFLSGDMGLARAGLMALEASGPEAAKALPSATAAHLRPKPKVLIGTLLNAAGVKSMMDVSDGLARDLPRLVGPELGASLDIREDMLHPEVIEFANAINADPVNLAIQGGEDYALVGAADFLDLKSKIESVPGIRVIGKVTDTPGLIVNGQPFEAPGFDHFEN